MNKKFVIKDIKPISLDGSSYYDQLKYPEDGLYIVQPANMLVLRTGGTVYATPLIGIRFEEEVPPVPPKVDAPSGISGADLIKILALHANPSDAVDIVKA